MFGPVPGNEVFEHMLTGDVDESTPISLGDGKWRPIRQLPGWHPFLQQARVRLREQRALAEAAAAAHRRRLLAVLKVTAAIAALVLSGSAVTYFIILQRAQAEEERWLTWSGKHPPLLLAAVAWQAQKSKPGEKPDEPQEAEVDKISIDEILIADAPALVGVSEGREQKERKLKKPQKRTTLAGEPEQDDVASLSPQDQLQRVRLELREKVYASSNLGRLKGCLVAEIKRNSDLPSPVTLSFSVDNSGGIKNVQVEEVSVESGPLLACFRSRLQQLRFTPFSDQVEVQNVTIPFNWK